MPLMTYLSPFLSALVLTMVTSLPASGSVMAKAIIASPFGIGERYFLFCSSVPKAWIISEPKLAAQRDCPQPGSTRQNCSVMRLCSRKPRPAPPYSSSRKTAWKPFAADRRQISRSNSSFSSNSFARSLNSPSANSRAALTISFCSCVSSIFSLPEAKIGSKPPKA